MTEVARTLHDRIFKEFLHRFLPEFLNLFFPEEAAKLDFSSLLFLDQELVVNLPGQTLRITDVVAEIATHDGEPEVIIVHLEVEGRDKRTVPQRMFEYYTLLRLLRQKEVLPLALLLTPNVGGISWPTYQETLFGRQLVTFQYGQVGLRDLSSEAYLGANPVAAALAVLMQPERESQTAVKLAGLRTVIDSQLTVGDKLFLIDIIETYLPTSALTNAEEEVMEALLQTELTWRERIAQESEFRGKQEGIKEGIKEGIREGVREGKADLLQRLLAAKFGRLPANFTRRLQAVDDTAVLDNLSEQLLTAVTLDDIKFPDEQE
jgi:hypothetical protein